MASSIIDINQSFGLRNVTIFSPIRYDKHTKPNGDISSEQQQQQQLWKLPSPPTTTKKTTKRRRQSRKSPLLTSNLSDDVMAENILVFLDRRPVLGLMTMQAYLLSAIVFRCLNIIVPSTVLSLNEIIIIIIMPKMRTHSQLDE